MTLRAVVAVGRQGAVCLRATEGGLYADDEPLLDVLPGVTDLRTRMVAGGLQQIDFDREPAAGEMLGLARAIATVDVGTGNAGALREHLEGLGATTLQFDQTVSDAPVSEAPAVEPPAASDAPEAQPYIADTQVPGLVAQNTGEMFFQFSSIGNVKDSPEALLQRLGSATNPTEIVRLLDDLVTLAETVAREGKPLEVIELMQGAIALEKSAVSRDVNRGYVLALRRLSKPLLLRTVAAQLLGAADRHDAAVAVLVRMGQDGAEAVIEQVTQAQTTEDRRVLFDVLQHMEFGVPALVHMLGDARWFVARNAADLLGELKAASAESALMRLLRHEDERVRRAGTNALMLLGTDSAREAVRAAVRDDAPQVRMQAAFAIAAHRDPQTAATLIMAIDAEQDSDVQLAMLLALGRVGTSEAVERLIEAAEPGRGFFKKKATAFRVAAVQALAEAHSPAAQAALKTLGSDKEKEVRDTVARLAQKGRRLPDPTER